MTQDPLVDELRKPEYASLDDQEAADAINAKTVTYRRPASSKQSRTHSGVGGWILDGWVDDARVYDRCLHTEEIRTLARRRAIAYEPK